MFSENTILETKRLFLREMNTEDYEALYAVLADSDIMKHYPYTFDEKRVMEWILDISKLQKYDEALTRKRSST